MSATPVMTLLIIEDNAGDARLIREMLAENDPDQANVTQVGTLGQAELHLATHPVDVILLDLGLPDAQGLDAVRRAHLAAPNVPLVILTGFDDESLAAGALQLGAQDYLVKGRIEPRNLSRSLRYAIERNRLDAALFAEKERAQVTLDSIGDAVASTDQTGAVTFLNAVAQALTGTSPEEARGRPIGAVLALHDAVSGEPVAVELAPSSTSDAIDFPSATVLRREDGTEIAIEGRIAAIHERDGRQAGAVIVFRDVTERRAAERARRRSEERFERLFDANTIGITIGDLAGETLEANDAYLDMLGYTRAGFRAGDVKWDELTPPEYREGTAAALAQLIAKGVAQPWEKEYIRRDGTRVPVLVGGALLEASEGTYISYIVDLSSRRLLEDQLRQAHKMEAIGQVAGGVAHDFSNLLTVILGHANLMVEQLADEDPIRESAEEIRDAAERAAGMTRQLLAFSRRQILEPDVLDINTVVAGLGRLLRRLTGDGVKLVIEPLPESGHVLADASQLTQVLMNMALNARDAMPGGGSLSITLGESEINGQRPMGTPGLAAGRYVTLAVRDTGVGMAAETRAHLFEPFFTTKARDKGTGLGLATAYGIVRQSGGDIAVVSELGTGTTFTIYLPWHDGTARSDLDESVAVARAAGRETILLVGDDKAVRLLTRRVLERHGYVVLEGADGEDALAIARDHREPIDLLLADLVMPLLNGHELARRVAEIRPDVAVVLMSALPEDATDAIAGGRIRYLQKPFTADHLVARLREAIGPPVVAPGELARPARSPAAS